MELLINVLGYAFILAVLGVVGYIFVKILTNALSALTNNDD